VNDKLKIDRIGEISLNKFGSIMEVVEYNNANDIWVKFKQGKPVHADWREFCKGIIKSPYDRSVFGVGYLGEGKYAVSKKYKCTPQYVTWKRMLERCYDEKFQVKNPTYKGCLVCDEWHNFQNFAKWHDENYYEIEGEIMHLDKDILVKNNNIYSPDKCCFVTKNINILFTKNNIKRGSLPIGVYWHKRDKKFSVVCGNGKGRTTHLGYHNTPEEAFKKYKSHKEKLIKRIAEEYISLIPDKLYKALISYQVEITD
jgi:hypothetical protein